MKLCPNCGYHHDLCRCDDVSSFKFKDDSSCHKSSNYYYSKPKENLIKPKERRVDSLSHSNSTKCPHCQSDPCCCPNIQIENNPTNTNTVSPVFNINITFPTSTPTPEPISTCDCTGELITTFNNDEIFVNGIIDVGDITTNIQICPECRGEDSLVRFTFSDDTPTPVNNSFTLVDTGVQLEFCGLSPTAREVRFSGAGVVTRANITTVDVIFNGGLLETPTPGAPDSFVINISSIDPVNNPFVARYSNTLVPEDFLTVETCPTPGL